MAWRTHIGRWGGALVPGEPWARWTLLVLLLIAALLRFWELDKIAYTHDEISGLVRTGYASFVMLIERGVVVDAHPPAVAVFLQYWTSSFGYGEAVVKAPFILASIVALFLLYRFFITWTNATVALVIVALLSTLQYTVMYGQIARPYSLGFFTCALLVDQWTRWLADGANARRALIGTSLAFVLCAYVHHFTLLFAGLVAATGFILASREQRTPYLLACGAAVLLYLPNVPIFLKQLSYGGVGQWLAAPDAHWLVDHVRWVLHYDVVLGALMATLVLLSLGFRVLRGTGAGPVGHFALFWGLTPLVIGFAYSILVDPVLQHSVLIFSFPFLLLAILSGLPEWGRSRTMGICALLVLVGVHGLVFERRHYALMYASKYTHMVEESVRTLDELGHENVVVLLDAPDEVIAFVQRQQGIAAKDLPHVQLRGTAWNAERLDSLLHTMRGRTVVYGQSHGAPPETVGRIQEHFPNVVYRRDMVEGQVLRFTDRPAEHAVEDRILLAMATPAARHGGSWDIHPDLPTVRDSIRGMHWWDLTGREYGVSVQLGMDNLFEHPQDVFEVVALLDAHDPNTDAGLVVELKNDAGVVFYRTAEWKELRSGAGMSTLLVATKPADAGRNQGPFTLQAYVHNRQGARLGLASLAVHKRAGNPLVYGLFSPLPSSTALHPAGTP